MGFLSSIISFALEFVKTLVIDTIISAIMTGIDKAKTAIKQPSNFVAL